MNIKLFPLFFLLIFSFKAFTQNGVTEIDLGDTLLGGFTSLVIDEFDNKWIGTYSNGLMKYDGNNVFFYNDTNSGLPSNKVEIMYENQNTIYCKLGNVTSSSLGVFDGTNWSFYYTTNGLLDDYIYCAFHDGQKLYIGTRSGVCILENDNWSYYTTENTPLESNMVKTIDKDQNGNLWFGVSGDTSNDTDFTGGLYKFDGNNWTKYCATNSILTNADGRTNIKTMKAGKNNELWIKLYKNHVFLFSGQSFYDINELYDWTVDTYEKIFVDKNGIAYLTKWGLIYEINNWQLNMYQHIKFGNSCIAFDSQNKFWFVNTIWINTTLYSFNQDEYYSLYCTNPVVNNQNFKSLDINNVKAGYLNRGDMFWDPVGRARYEIPKGSGKNSLFATALWIGGLDQEGELHLAAMKYRHGYDFFPGPLNISNNPGEADSSVCKYYDKIWKVDRYDVENLKYHFEMGDITSETYGIPGDILSWPANGYEGYEENLAPFVDINMDGTYNPYDGDYPDIKGDQMLWWVFNDNLAEHTESEGNWDPENQVILSTLSMGIEVQASAYAYLYEDSQNDSINAINNTTFINYKIFNRSDTAYDSVYVGIWTEADLGKWDDDYVGSNVTLNSYYFYNGKPMDGDGNMGTYGINPPAQSVTFLNAPVELEEDKPLMSKFMIYYSAGYGPMATPRTNIDFYNYLRGFWRDNTQLTYGGVGYQSGGVPCDYMFPGDSDPNGYGTGGIPQEPWSEETEGNEPFDRRGVGSVGPFTLEAGEMVEFDVAFVWSRGDNGPMSSVDKLFTDIENVTSWYRNNNFPSNYNFQVKVDEIKKSGNGTCIIFPNPAKDQIFVEFENEGFKPLTYRVYNINGQLLSIGKIQNTNKLTIDISHLYTGTYILEFISEGITVSEKFVKK